MSFPRYPKYKASGVEWLGDVPEEWEVKRLKHIAEGKPFAIVDGPFGTQLKADDYRPEGVPLVRISNLSYDGHFSSEDLVFIDQSKAKEVSRSAVKRGDIVVGKTGATIGKSALFDYGDEGIIASSCIKITPDIHEMSSRFVLFTIVSGSFQRTLVNESGGSTRDTINITPFGNLKIAAPPIAEQTAIAEFLDRETAKIDALVAEQQRLIELLKEKRQAVISHAVTKGLDPKAPLRPSGIAWLGEIPRHWNRTRIKRIARPGNNTFVDGDWIETPYITTEGVRLLQCGNIGTGVFEEQGFRYVSEKTFDTFGCTEVEPGDVLICRLQSSRTILAGRACLAPNLGVKMITSVDNCIVKPSNEFDPRYIVYQLSTNEYLSFVEAVARGGTRDRISRSMLGNIDLVAPPLIEQKQIADFIESELAKFDALTAEAQRAIELLQERRTALITAAVTGQIDVREQLPN